MSTQQECANCQVPISITHRDGGVPWVIISDYPAWPSPYFAQLVRYAPQSLSLQFRPNIEATVDMDCAPGVLNLHRLKRLYREQDGTRSERAAQVFLQRLASLRQNGWRIVWTVHNLLPIDGGPPNDVDCMVTDGVLLLADTIICHTHADGDYFRQHTTHKRVVVAGWSGMPTGIASIPTPEVAKLVKSMQQCSMSFLLLGNMTAYKDLPGTFKAFLSSTSLAQLFAIGPCRDAALAEELARIASVSNGRIHLEIVRVDLADVQHLYVAAVAALCPYASIGPYKFFTHVLHPSSVGTAVVFGVPVIAPKLPSIVEMTFNHPHILYDPLEGPGEAFKTAERVFTQPTEAFLAGKWMPSNRVPYNDGERWRLILRTYEAVAFELLASDQRQKKADGDVSDTLD